MSRQQSTKGCMPRECALSTAVWCVMLQHCIFNGTKYFFASWMPIYFNQVFKMQPQHSGFMLTVPELSGLIVPVIVSRAEKYALDPEKGGLTLLQSRTFFACAAFGLTCIPMTLMGFGATSPMYMTVLLC